MFFGSKYTLITAITMTFAAMAWGFNFFIALNVPDVFPTRNFFVFGAFVVLAVFYWISYFRGKKPETPTQDTGTE